MSQLDPHAANLLKAEYGPHMPARPAMAVASPFHFAPPSGDLIAAMQRAAEEFGIPSTAIDWTTFLPALITAISTGNWLTLIPMIVSLVTNYGPQVWAFIQNIIQLFKQKPAPSTGPTITEG